MKIWTDTSFAPATAMDDTSLSLLDRLGRPDDNDSWQRLVDMYSPLLRGWLARYEVQTADVDDLLQDVLVVVMRELPRFRHNEQPGAFRTWLRRILVNRLRNFWRSRGRELAAGDDSGLNQRLNELEDAASQLSQIWDREHNQYVVRKLLELIAPRFEPTTNQVFRRLVLDGLDADQVAAELGLSLGAVFTAKSRVLRELRRLGRGMLD